MAKTAKTPPRTFIQRSRSVSPEQKAMYHAVLGTGRRRVVRDFFDVSADDQTVVAERLQQVLDRRIARQA